MKKLITIIGFLGLTLTSFADRYVLRHEDIKTFLGTTTYVVLENNPMSEYNIKIREAVKNSWTITPYKFITTTEFEEMRSDITKSFLVMLQVKFPRDKLEATYNFLCVVLGAGVKRHTDMPDICSVPLSYSTVPEENYAYKLEGLIRFAQKHINLLNENPSFIRGNAFKRYNRNRKQAHTKELWLLERDVEKSIRSLADIRKHYPHAVRLVNQADIEKAIAERNENVVFLHKVGPEGTRLQARCYKMIIGASDGQLYYYHRHMISKKAGDGFLARDFKRFGR